MSKYLQPHQEYMTFKLKILASVNPEALEGYSDIIQMFRYLNFDPAYPLLCELYSHTGRYSLAQIEISRFYLNISWEHFLFSAK